jgi:neutral ceramidase
VTVLAGVASRDVTPPAGAAMSGFAARETPATGVHDPLLVHALVVGDTALVTVDVVGLHEDDCAEIRERCGLPPAHVVVHATHTHGGPVSMRGRLGDRLDEGWLAAVVRACAESVAEASARREPAHIAAGYGERPAVARNRRRPGGPVDDEIPVVLLRRSDGSLLASVVSYACSSSTCPTAPRCWPTSSIGSRKPRRPTPPAGPCCIAGSGGPGVCWTIRVPTTLQATSHA